MIQAGQLPISTNNIEVIPRPEQKDLRTVITEKSEDADLCIIGFRDEIVKHVGRSLFEGYDSIGNTLFVNAAQEKEIK